MKKLNLLLLLFMFGLVGTMSGQTVVHWSINPDAGGASLKVVVTDNLTGDKKIQFDYQITQGEEGYYGNFTVPNDSTVEYFASITGGRLQCVTTEHTMWTDYYQESIYSPYFSLFDEGVSWENGSIDLSSGIFSEPYIGGLTIHLFAY